MRTVQLGRTGLVVNRNGFGALPIQRDSRQEAVRLLRKAYDHDIRFFDTARAYSDSEEKVGEALSPVRDQVILATKTHAKTAEAFWRDLETSLRLLRTDHVDIYQFHMASYCPRPGDEAGLYDCMLEARRQGKIRFIGLTSHSFEVAREAVESGLYDTLQFPFSYLAAECDEALVHLCREKNVGFICMKALAGGLITRSDAAYAYLAQFDNTLPIWGVQRETELDEFISYQTREPVMTEEIRDLIERDRHELAGDFCRGCGYCLPCPAGIPIPTAARMSLLLRRAPVAGSLSPEMQAQMARIDQCIGCRHCADHCPYHLDTPALLKKNYADYKSFLNDK